MLQSCQNKHTGNLGNAPESALLPSPRTMVSLTVFFILIILIPGFCFETEMFAKHDIPNACCHTYARRQIPYRLVVDFYETSSLCPKPGVIFLTNKGHQICANPRSEWVQSYIFSLKQKKKTEEYYSQIEHFYSSVELSPPEE
ncbi:C-C motif chemokine 4 homolog [Vombatus ursinus]|uniref:C-C motif chemokine 5 n=1 Tax=Vombatus ursinus TaxID=29139 RepID=A0A4X2LIV5_VOMUR|nr:C-C motif chemokine 4 homolog [Vombatus ursinus]XP_027717420.1 C-C motif chemokine 4 homolog [Vombatus ursinus]